MTASPGDGEHAAREGYYPDPSIPGYVRYWNGVSWVPGTSRPAPPAPADETGPLFLDQTSVTELLPDPGPEPGEGAGRGGAEAAGWQADPAQQSGFGGSRDHRVSWGGPAESAPAPEPERAPEAVIGSRREPDAGRAPARSAGAPVDRGARQEPLGVPAGGISLARTPAAAAASAPSAAPAASAPATRFPAQASAGRGSAEGVGILSARSPVSPAAPEWPEAPGGTASGITSAWPQAAPRAASAAAPAPQEARRAPAASAPPTPTAPARRDAPRPQDPLPAARWSEESRHGSAPSEESRHGSARPQDPLPAARRPEELGHGSARSEESRQESPRSEELHPKPPEPVAARPQEPVRPPKATPREVFERMAERAVRPAGLFRRAVARALDSLVLGAVAAGAAWPLVPDATAHLQAKVDAARGRGQSTTVWLLDATIAGYLGMVLAAVLLFGVFYEVLPTARWGRTPGKKLLGVRVLAVTGLRPPGFGAALRRWLVYALLGVPGSLWCLVDRPRRQAWHDKAARTYVAR
ncbi:RDD family protein [Streptomyces sp. NPDC002990]